MESAHGDSSPVTTVRVLIRERCPWISLPRERRQRRVSTRIALRSHATHRRKGCRSLALVDVEVLSSFISFFFRCLWDSILGGACGGVCAWGVEAWAWGDANIVGHRIKLKSVKD